MSVASDKLPRVSTKFEEEYVRSIEARYSIKVPSKSDERSSMGSSLSKVRNPVSTGSPNKFTPEKENGRLLRQVSPNEKHTVPRKNAEAASINIKNRLHPTKTTASVSERKLPSKSRKRKAGEVGLDSDKIKRKRRRVNNIIKRLAISPDCCDHQSVIDSPLRGLRNTIAAKRAGGLNVKETAAKRKLENAVDKKSVHRDSINLNLKELYKTKLKEAGSDIETSPFKGKMSAFAISLLKGKQSVERRKSLEASTLRSSPRMNSNLQPPNYSDVKRQRSVRSLSASLSAVSKKQKLSADIDSQSFKARARKRRRKNCKRLLAVSPSSVENQFVAKSKKSDSPSKRRKRRSSRGNSLNNSMPEIKVHSPKASKNSTLGFDNRKTTKSSTAFTYRMNGSPKLKGLPAVLSLNNLSGIPQKVQGSSFTSFHKGFCANGLSGKPPALSTSPHVLDVVGDSSAFFKPSPRPSSLAVEKNADVFQVSFPSKSTNADSASKKRSSTVCTDDCEGVIQNGCKNLNELKEQNKRLLLEETVNMLRRSSGHLSVRSGSSSTRLSTTLSPTISEGRVSRRSSRSSTPNISPIKSEILTPSCTPCSTPNKSPRASPNEGKVQKAVKKKHYLFFKHDDVLARWHDGLFYLGKILRIDDKNNKCLLRYEDNSEYWSLFKDIHRVVKEEEMICCVCLGEASEPPNEIVLCDHCSQGYHQKCHTPYIGSGQIVDPDDEWYCRQCVFFMTVKLGGALKEDKRADELRRMKLTLPYNIDQLTWDVQHKGNVEQSYCYCGGPGIWYQKMLQCCRCKQWFHEACMQCTEYPLLFADSFFIFVCSPCNSGDEYIKRLDVEWSDLVHIALFNLALDQRRKYFDLTSDIMPWLQDNWNMLQVKEYDGMSAAEKHQHVEGALRNNKNRFSSGSELRKKYPLWGLRVRVPPPRIHITLPMRGKVTDEVMKRLKIKGRRSKVFTPVECKSPINLIKHSPLPAKRVDKALTKKVDGTYSPVHNQGTPHVRKSKPKLPLLENLIPRQSSYADHQHPFKTDIEQLEEKTVAETRAKIWSSFLSSLDTKVASENGSLMNENEDAASDGPPVLEKVEPVVPNCNVTPPMPEIEDKKPEMKEKKKQSRKSVSTSVEDSEDRKRSQRISRRSQGLKLGPLPNLTDLQNAKDEISVKKVKSSVGHYFYAYDKTGYGLAGFHVYGKRVKENLAYDYLIHWDK